MGTVQKIDDTRNVPGAGSQQAALYARARRIVARMRAARAARPADLGASHPGPKPSWNDDPALAALAREARRVRGLLMAAARAGGVVSAPSAPRARSSRTPTRPGVRRPASRRSASSAGGGDPGSGDPDPAGDHQLTTCATCRNMFTAGAGEALCWACWVDTRNGVLR